MSHFKILLVYILTLFLTAGSSAPQVVVKWAVQQHSSLNVKGSSNVNHFSCSIKSIGVCDTLQVTGNTSNSLALKGCIKMDVLSFDCDNHLVQKDLRKTLKVEEYPKMTIRFISLKKMPGSGRQPENIPGWVEVELAGVKKAFELNYSFSTNNAGQILLNGEKKFCFSDFKLTAPRKLAGLVRIRDEFDVSFNLILKRV